MNIASARTKGDKKSSLPFCVKEECAGRIDSVKYLKKYNGTNADTGGEGREGKWVERGG